MSSQQLFFPGKNIALKNRALSTQENGLSRKLQLWRYRLLDTRLDNAE